MTCDAFLLVQLFVVAVHWYAEQGCHSQLNLQALLSESSISLMQQISIADKCYCCYMCHTTVVYHRHTSQDCWLSHTDIYCVSASAIAAQQ